MALSVAIPKVCMTCARMFDLGDHECQDCEKRQATVGMIERRQEFLQKALMLKVKCRELYSSFFILRPVATADVVTIDHEEYLLVSIIHQEGQAPREVGYYCLATVDHCMKTGTPLLGWIG